MFIIWGVGWLSEKKKAMVIAVSEYENGLHPLDFCENDGKSMRGMLASRGYEIDERYVLIGKVDGVQMRDAIFDFFNDHATRANDVVLFYYSGHGVPDRNTVYLASSDTDPNFPTKRGFAYDDLTKMMNSCTSTKVVTILDSCYSGSASLGKGPTDAAVMATQLISKGATQDEGKCILAASQSYQEAYGTREGDHSIFTHYLLKGLNGDKNAIDRKGNVTPDSLGRYVYDKVTSVNPNQKPIRKVAASGDIILAAFPEFADKIPTAPSSPDPNSALLEANNLFAIGEYGEAISQYNKVLEINPKNIAAWNNKAKVFEKLIMYNEAVECLNRAIEINAKDYLIWYNKGNILAKQNRFNDALVCYDTAISLNPKDRSSWKNKSYALSKIGRNAEARECYETFSNLGIP